MAITNIHPITSTIDLCLKYVKRDKFELQDNTILRHKTITSHISCTQSNEHILFLKQRQYYIDNGHLIRLRKDGLENFAFHMVQSFDKQIDPMIANEIGRKLAEELLSEYSCVVSTHSNGDYTHNHIVFNAYKMDGSGKWHDCDETVNRTRELSDRLCEEYGLSVINEHRNYKPIHWKDKSGRQRSYEPSVRKEKLRKDRVFSEHNSFDMIQKKISRALKSNQSFTQMIKADIDDAVKKSASYENLLQLLMQKGYIIKSKKKDGDWLKHISFKAPGAVRGISDRSLGLEYGRGKLAERISKTVSDRRFSINMPSDLKNYIYDDISNKSRNIEILNSRKRTALNQKSIEYLKNCINTNIAALNTIEKYRVTEFIDIENRLEYVSERVNLLNVQFNDMQKRILKMCGMSSVLLYFNLFETELFRFQRKYSLLHNFYDEYSSCISTLRRIDRENRNMLSAGIKKSGLSISTGLANIFTVQALLSNIIENGINLETEYPIIKPLSVTQLTTIAKMKAHPDYAAAKSGDVRAAFRLVNEVVLNGPDYQRKIKELGQKYPDAIIVGVFNEESAGKNKIPLALVEKIAYVSGIETDRSIVQMNKVSRTGSDGIYRLAHRPIFAGAVQVGRRYILADDVITAGGTLSELRSYIEGRGGEVVHLVSGGAAENSTNFALSDKTRFELESKHGIIALKNFVKEFDLYGGKLEYLTESEGKLLLRFKSLNAARSRIVEARTDRIIQDIRRIARNRIPER